MTRRVVVFMGRDGWYMTQEYNGDKDEMQYFAMTDSCDENWPAIARRFSQAKTLKEFTEVNNWAQGLYHSHVAKPRPTKPQMYRPFSASPDELLSVHEDIGATGINTLGQCPNCGRSYPVTYNPDGTVSSPGKTCISCGTPLRTVEELPSQYLWEEALDIYHAPPATYQVVANGDVRNPVAAAHKGQPVKIQKIVAYTCGEFSYEVLFRDWKTDIIRNSELELTPRNQD